MRYFTPMPEPIYTGELVTDDQLAAHRNAGGRGWQTRRRLMFAVVAFCMLCISWALYQDTDTIVMQSAVTSGFATMAAILGSYVFGAVWEDKR